MENRNSYKPSFLNKNTSTQIKSNSNKGSNVKLIIITICILIVICIVIFITLSIVHYYKTNCYQKKNFFEYLFNFSNNNVCILETEPVPELPVQLPPEKPIINLLPNPTKKEVFHIANQDYTYSQSKCKCESYGGRLATKAEVIDAYNNGANWCNYGWTDNQSAYYPVQQCDWDILQKNNERLPDKDKKYCGLPGINGGYFANPELKFGANCFGVKPKGELNKPKVPYCPPMNFCKLESNFEASHKLDTDEIVGFNNEQWSENM